jgi:nucleoside-diphosphate-sugar epimerase
MLRNPHLPGGETRKERVTFVRYLIIGTGYTGQRIARRLADRDDHAVAGTRTEADSSNRPYPIFPFQIEDPGSITAIIDELGWEQGVPINLIYTPGPPRTDSMSDGLELIHSFLEQLPQERLRSFLFISSTSVYGDADGDWVDESSPLEPVSRSGRYRVNIETTLTEELDDSVATIITRPGGIYGPGRNGFHRYLSDYELVDGGQQWTNRIHVSDLARACIFLVERGQSTTANVVDGNPVRLGDLVRYVYEKVGKDPDSIESISWQEAEEQYSEMKLGLLKPNKRVRSDRLQEMGFSFDYPSVYEGLDELWDQQNPPGQQ